MRVLFILLIATVVVIADDKSYCHNSCAKKYVDEKPASACQDGCDFRGSLGDGSFAFLECHQKCDTKFENLTTEEAAPCHFACSLPMTNMVFMSVNYNGNGEPEVKVVRHDGPDDSSASIEDIEKSLPSGSGDIFTALGLNNGPRLGHLPSEDDNEHQNHWDEFERMQARLENMFDDFRRRFFARVHSEVVAGNNGERGRIYISRPNGHEAFSSIGRSVGNSLPDGRPIIISHPISNDGDMPAAYRDGVVFEWREQGRRHPMFFQFAFLALAMVALMLSMVMMLRVIKLRKERYSQLRNSSVFANTRATPAPMAAALPVKKIPLTEDYSEPSGVPPPAYDQLSIHQKEEEQKQKEEK